MALNFEDFLTQFAIKQDDMTSKAKSANSHADLSLDRWS